MAITNAIMQMRRGLEADFDPYQMHPGEWAVSTDKKYVRMCFSPGICVRMATYEAFEKDMEQIVVILEEAKTVQEAIEKIYEEFKDAQLDIEEAKNYAILSESYAVGGTGTRDGEDTDNAKYYAESVSGAVSDIALNRQTLGYTKKNLFDYKEVETTWYKPTTSYIYRKVFTLSPNTQYTLSSPVTNGKDEYAFCFVASGEQLDIAFASASHGALPSKTVTADDNGKITVGVYTISSDSTITVENANVQLELGDTATDYEPYVDDVNTRLENVETEVTPIERGGTGGTTAKEAQYNLLNDMNTESGYNDDSLIVGAYASADAEKGILHKKTFATLWAYIKAKAETVFAKIADVTPVANLLATVAGKPLDATMGKELNDKIETLGGFTPVIDETTGKMTGYTTTIGGADTVFPFSGENTLLLALYIAPLTTTPVSASSLFSNEDYFENIDSGFVCKNECIGTVYIRYMYPMYISSEKGTITFTIAKNEETIYSITSDINGNETIEFSCKVGDVITMTGRSSGYYGRAPVFALFVGN